MMDSAQIILLFVIVVSTILLLILGIQVFFILKEFRKTVAKANKVLDDTGIITESVSGPISTLSSLTAGVKVGRSILSFLKKRKKTIDNFIEDKDEDNE